MIALLVFFITNAAFGASGPSLVSTRCQSLVIRTGLSEETATEKYIQYVRHFLKEGGLEFNDLKVIRGFAVVPNIADIFSAKIPESYVYHENIQELLPFINLSRFHELLDELIKEKTKESELKQTATNETEEVPLTFGEVQRGFEPVKDPTFYFPLYFAYANKDFAEFRSPDAGAFLIKTDNPQGPLLISSTDNTVFNLRTKQKLTYEDVTVANPINTQSNARWVLLNGHLIEFKGQTYMIRFNDFTAEVMVHNANTGEKYLQARQSTISRSLSDHNFKIFTDENGETNLAAAYTLPGRDQNIIVFGNGSRKAQIDLPSVDNGFQWVSTAQGELYAAYTYSNKVGHFLAFSDVSKLKKSGPLLNISLQKSDESLVGLTENNRGGFTALLKSDVAEELRFRSIDFQRNGEVWGNTDFTYKPLSVIIEGALRNYNSPPVILRDAKGELSFLIHSSRGLDEIPAYVIKPNEREAKPVGFMPLLISSHILTRSDGSQVLVGESGLSAGFYIFDTREGQVRKIQVAEHEPLRAIDFAGVGLSANDDVLLYFGSRQSLPSYEFLTPVRVTGTFKPGEMK